VSALNGSAPWPQPPSPLTPVPGSREPPFEERKSMKTEKLASHSEAREALWLSVAGVMVVMLIWNVIMVTLKLY